MGDHVISSLWLDHPFKNSGDPLSAIAQQFYGNSGLSVGNASPLANRIFQATRDQLNTP